MKPLVGSSGGLVTMGVTLAVGAEGCLLESGAGSGLLAGSGGGELESPSSSNTSESSWVAMGHLYKPYLPSRG